MILTQGTQHTDTVKAELAELRALPPPWQHLARGWHQYTNTIIGSEDSRSAPSYTYMSVLMHKWWVYLAQQESNIAGICAVSLKKAQQNKLN